MLTKTSYWLLNELLIAEGPATLQQLAGRVGASSRTVWGHLGEIEAWLGQGSQLIRKPGVGISLRLSHDDYLRALQQIESEEEPRPFSSSDRQQFLFIKLLQNDPNFRTLQDFADALYVSRLGISKDLEAVKKTLAYYGLKLIRRPHYGLEVSGSEQDWRRAVADYLTQTVNKDVLLDVLSDNLERSLISPSRIDPVSYRQIRSLFPEYDIRIVRRVLENVERNRGTCFTDDNFLSLLIHLVIGLDRIRRSKTLTMTDQQLDTLREQEEFHLAGEIARHFEESLDVKIPEAEIGYIALHLLGAKIQYGSLKIELDVESFDPDLTEMAKGIVHEAERVLHVVLANDRQLLLGLILHLRPVINRLKYGMPLRNPLLKEIKEQYPAVFEAALVAGRYLEKRLKLSVGEEELGFLAMHLGASIERGNRSRRVLVVCSSGIGSSQLLASRLRKLVPQIEVIDIISELKLNEQYSNSSEGIDAIITTVPLAAHCKYPMIRVSPLLTDQDQKRIRDFLSIETTTVQSTPGVPGEDNKCICITSYMEENLAFLKMDLRDKFGIISKMAKKIEDMHYVKAGFQKSVVEREKFQETSVGNLVAIPHPYTGFISTPRIAVGTLQSPIAWGKRDVQIIFMIAVNASIKDECPDFFEQLNNLVFDHELVPKLINCTNYNNLCREIETRRK